MNEEEKKNFLVRWVTHPHGWYYTLFAFISLLLLPEEVFLVILGPLAFLGFLDELVLLLLVLLWPLFKRAVMFFSNENV